MISKRTASAKRFFSCQSTPQLQRQTKDEAIAVAAEVALESSDPKLTEALLEIARPMNLADLPNPYDEYWEQEYAEAVRSSKDGRVFLDAIPERRDATELGELRRRLYVAERHGFVKLAAMWRRLIEKEREEHGE